MSKNNTQTDSIGMNTLKIKNKDSSPMNRETMYLFHSYCISQLEGTILTFIDASIQDPVQRKALKDLLPKRKQQPRKGNDNGLVWILDVPDGGNVPGRILLQQGTRRTLFHAYNRR